MTTESCVSYRSKWLPDTMRFKACSLLQIMSLIQSGKDQGATLQAGGGRHGDRGYYVQPTVFSDVQGGLLPAGSFKSLTQGTQVALSLKGCYAADHFTIARDEIFGPVQSILKWDTMGEVLERANNTEYGLAAGVVSNDENSINTLSRGLRAGTIWVNTWNQVRHVLWTSQPATNLPTAALDSFVGCKFDVGVPFGGYKTSGIGREHGEEVLSHYTQVLCAAWMLFCPI